MKFPRLLLIWLLLLSWGVVGRAQETENEVDDKLTRNIDSVMAISPLYLPTSYTALGSTFFKPVEYQVVDTSLDNLVHYDPLLKTQNLYQSLGIFGQAHRPMNFSFRRDPGFSLISNPFPLYFKEQTDLKYYNLKTSYTQLAFTYGLETENTFYATHAQNIRDWAEIVVNLRGYGNNGYFTHQQTNNVVADVLCHFELPTEIYGFRLSYIVNHFKMQENGGIQDIVEFLSHANKDQDENQEFNVRLYSANSHLLTHDLMFQQYLNIESKKKDAEEGAKRHWGTFTHTFQFKQQRYCFYDDPVDSAYYPISYALTTDTLTDTLSFYVLSNTLQFSTFPPFKEPSNKRYFFHLTGGITHEYTNYRSAFYAGNAYTPFAQMHARLFTRLELSAKIYYTLGRKPKPSESRKPSRGCYQNNDLNFSASVNVKLDRKELHQVGAEFDFYFLSPDYIFTYFINDHAVWDNNWPKQNIIRLTPYWQYRDYRVEFSYFMLHNYLYWDENREPAMLDSYANILQLHLYAPFRYKGLGIIFNGYLQYSNKQVIQVPLVAGKLDVFYRFPIFKNKAKLEFGLAAAYNTKYYADAYYPMLHQFYHQHSIKVGNYLYMDIYVALQVQRIRFFVKGVHLLSGLMGYHYFTTPAYPMQDRRVSIGIAWRFHD
ncbi:MAG: putative porin [Bacteroidales bacterium]|nr:putative porin [Bacteroidales bacterium]